VSALFIPAVTTNYVFFLASDDDADLFLSTDANPADKHLIAQETVWSNSRQWVSSGGGSILTAKRSDQFSGTTWPGGATITLNAGTQYYLEGVHHQGNGGDAFGVTYKFAGEADPANGDAPRLTSSVLAVNAYNNTYISISSQPGNVAVAPGATATFNVTAVSGYLGDPVGVPAPPLLSQWQSQPFGAGSFADISGAASSSYTTPTLGAADDGSHFRVTLTTVAVSTTSSSATLTVGQLKFTQISANAGQITLQWSGNAVLEESPSLTGLWTVSANQNNPQTIPAVGMKFYRLRQ
jgi:hypothetical protein